MKVCVIPAGGLQTRWKAASPKHLADIGGEPAIWRLHRQLKPHFDKIYVLAWREEIKTLFPDAIEPASKESLMESLLATKPLWHDRTVWVYGDVVLTNKDLNTIVRFNGPIQFFGHYSEIFAISFDRTMHERWESALKTAVTWTQQKWGTYRGFWGMPMRPEGRDPPDHDGGKKEFTHFTDWSCDIDDLECLPLLYDRMRQDMDL